MNYLIVESRDPFDSADTGFTHRTATDLAARGHSVTLFLVQNGVLPARKGSKFAAQLENLIKNKIVVWADDFSLKERAISADALATGVKPVSIDTFVKTLVENKPTAFWH